MNPSPISDETRYSCPHCNDEDYLHGLAEIRPRQGPWSKTELVSPPHIKGNGPTLTCWRCGYRGNGWAPSRELPDWLKVGDLGGFALYYDADLDHPLPGAQSWALRPPRHRPDYEGTLRAG